MRSLAIAVLTAALVLPAAAASAQGPDFMWSACLDRADKTLLGLVRAKCDYHAESKGYQHGVVRPANANDDLKETCLADVTAYVCAGVPGRDDLTK